MSAAKSRLVSRVWQTDLENTQIGVYSDGDHLQVCFFEDDIETNEAFLAKKHVRELHEEFGKWLEAVK